VTRRLKTFRERLASPVGLPKTGELRSDKEVAEAYQHGFEGVIYDPDAADELASETSAAGLEPIAAAAVDRFGLAETGKGKLTLLYPEVWKAFGNSDFYPGIPRQQCGDCVSHSLKHSLLASLSCAVNNGTGSVPKVTEAGLKCGGFHPSPTYWLRHHAGDGWSCAESVRQATGHIGIAVCQEYGDPLNFDLTQYSASVAHKWGRSPPPENIQQQLGGHKVVTSTRCSSFEEIRDLLAAGYGITTCGGEGWSSERDSNGVSRRRGHWSHALCYLGADDTDWAHKNYGGPLILITNSWGKSWNSGPRAIHGDKSIGEIPDGCFWTRWEDCSRRDCYAISSVHGWPNQKLKDWNLRGLI